MNIRAWTFMSIQVPIFDYVVHQIMLQHSKTPRWSTLKKYFKFSMIAYTNTNSKPPLSILIVYAYYNTQDSSEN